MSFLFSSVSGSSASGSGSYYQPTAPGPSARVRYVYYDTFLNHGSISAALPEKANGGELGPFLDVLLTFFKLRAEGLDDIWVFPVVQMNHHSGLGAQRDFCSVGFKVKDSYTPDIIHYLRFERNTEGVERRPLCDSDAATDPCCKVEDVEVSQAHAEVMKLVASAPETSLHDKAETGGSQVDTISNASSRTLARSSSNPVTSVIDRIFHRTQGDSTRFAGKPQPNMDYIPYRREVPTKWKANDRVYPIYDDSHSCTPCVSSLTFSTDKDSEPKLSLLHVVLIATTIHMFESVYLHFEPEHQQYCFAMLLVAVAREWTSGAGEPEPVAKHDRDTTLLVERLVVRPGPDDTMSSDRIDTVRRIVTVRAKDLIEVMVPHVLALAKRRWETEVDKLKRAAEESLMNLNTSNTIADVDSMKGRIKAMQRTIEAKDDIIGSMRGSIGSLEGSVEALRSLNAALKEQVERQAKKAEEEREEARRERAALEEELAKYRMQGGGLSAQSEPE